jgi:hypothetical protein
MMEEVTIKLERGLGMQQHVWVWRLYSDPGEPISVNHPTICSARALMSTWGRADQDTQMEQMWNWQGLHINGER